MPVAVVTISVMDGLKHLRVRPTDVAGVWNVSLPLVLNHQAVKSERDSMVTTLMAKLPFLALYSSADCPADRELRGSEVGVAREQRKNRRQRAV